MCPSRFGKQSIKISKRNTRHIKGMKISNNCDVVKVHGEFYLHMPIACVKKNLPSTGVVSILDLEHL